MLLYSYNRNVGTNRALDGFTLPTSPTIGYSHWHLGSALGYTSADDILDMRFYCSTSRHSRVIHFKTANRIVRGVAISGTFASGNSASYWNSGWTALSNHSANLPASTTSGNTHGAFHEHPFYAGGHWSIYSTYAECDDTSTSGTSSHQVWARLVGPPSSSPTTSAPTYPPSFSPTAAPTVDSQTPTRSAGEHPLKDNWFRKREVARQRAFPQKYAWMRKQAKRNAAKYSNQAA
mmetsp:Transcript_29968/g.56547  ORF Transcript_29968/g.56547 Transcript_29968/m.56547 type:complete len:234 (+) Transcript_29968:2-703(+)